MDREHHFKIEEAKRYGIEKAIILYNIRFWLDKNRANKKNIFNRDGVDYFWTYNSASSYGELFPYISERSISRYLMELEVEDKILISGNFNKMAYDRTKWFTMQEYKIGESISQNGGSIGQIGEPIPDSNTDKNTDVSTLVETNKEDMKFNNKSDKSEKEKLILSIYHEWVRMATAALEVDEKFIDKKPLMRCISTTVNRETDWKLEDYKSLFKYFFADTKMAHEKKLSCNLCMSVTYMSQYKLSKKGAKKKYASFADVSGDIKL